MGRVKSKKTDELPVTEELDFQYLLELMPPLHNEPEFSWLPELFTLLGHEKLINLCKYAGGQVIKIPTLEQLSDSIDALQWYYDVEITHKKDIVEIPVKILPLFQKIKEIYDARNSKELHTGDEE